MGGLVEAGTTQAPGMTQRMRNAGVTQEQRRRNAGATQTQGARNPRCDAPARPELGSCRDQSSGAESARSHRDRQGPQEPPRMGRKLVGKNLAGRFAFGQGPTDRKREPLTTCLLGGLGIQRALLSLLGGLGIQEALLRSDIFSKYPKPDTLHSLRSRSLSFFQVLSAPGRRATPATSASSPRSKPNVGRP